MGKLTFILGGARSGKSALAEKLAQKHPGRVLYIATAEALDEEMQARIRAHQALRPENWQTLESPRNVARALQEVKTPYDLVLLDCLTLLVSNLLLAHSEPEAEQVDPALDAVVSAEVDALLAEMAHSPADWIVVSNEVGLGLVPPYPLGRAFRDLLGRANQRLAAQANAAYLLVAGMALPLHAIKVDVLD